MEFSLFKYLKDFSRACTKKFSAAHKNDYTATNEEIFLRRIYRKYIRHNSRVTEILELKTSDVDMELVGERDIPSNEKFQSSGWYKQMLLRYGLAMYFGKGKNILETCSGLGWGGYLLDGIANCVTCVDIDGTSVAFSRRLWNTGKTFYVRASVLNMPFKDGSFDVVTAMESIEHFSREEIPLYIYETYRLLKAGGILVGSSFFPETRDEADTLCAGNEFHRHICTKGELHDFLDNVGFEKIRIFKNRLFFSACKPGSN